MAKTCTLALLSALVVLSLLVSPIACSRKLAKAVRYHKPAAVKGHKNQTTTNPSSSAAYGAGWLPAGATYYGNPNGDGSDG